jgi:type VI secretion system protein VasD
VAIRLFYLTATAKFERADVFALTEHERATLGEDSAGSEEFVLRPGESRSITRTPKSGVQFLGAAVLFRDIDSATWRMVQPVAASGPTHLRLAITGIKATLVTQG